jgi:hypothetical protein
MEGGKCIETWLNVRSRSPYIHTQGAEEEEEEEKQTISNSSVLLLSSSKLYRTGCTASVCCCACPCRRESRESSQSWQAGIGADVGGDLERARTAQYRLHGPEVGREPHRAV